MSTRCLIGAEGDSGRVVNIYCHNDGGNYTRDILNQYYTDPQKVAALIKKGDISFIGYGDLSSVDDYHSRGDDWKCCKPGVAKDTDEFFSVAAACGAEFAYLFTDETWLVSEI